MEFIKSMGLNVFSGNLQEIEITEGNKILNTISPNSYGISTKDKIFRQALQASDILVLDGVYFGLSALLLKGKRIIRNQGPDVFYYFMKKMNAENGKVFFLGSSNETLEKIRNKAALEYPNITVSGYSPPYKARFDDEDNRIMIENINTFKPDILFIGMTCPKQEKWSFQHKNKINAKLTCSIGAVFDWYAGNEKNIAPIWWKLRLVWLIRTIDRPEILKRYPNIGIFFLHLFLAILGIKKYKNGTF
jgi:N-acetylglucosaminyldiphosphoundecaprenol N-acetyl-beta-D-mannosaminyltransferase